MDHFGKENVFYDVDSIPIGKNFRRFLDNEVSRCNVLLAIIGPRWLNQFNDQKERRLDTRNDFVRIEIESALKREIPVVPILVGDAQIPNKEENPATRPRACGSIKQYPDGASWTTHRVEVQ